MRARQFEQGRTLALVCLALAVQSLYPAGYMPASIASGWPVMLCPDGLPAGFLDARADQRAHHHAHHHTGHHGGQHGEADDGAPSVASDGCPLGKALQSPALTTSLPALVSGFEPPARAATPAAAPPVLRLRRARGARAPPRFSFA